MSFNFGKKRERRDVAKEQQITHSLEKAGKKICRIRQAEGAAGSRAGNPPRSKLAVGQGEGERTVCRSGIVVPGGASRRPSQHPVAKPRSARRLIGV